MQLHVCRPTGSQKRRLDTSMRSFPGGALFFQQRRRASRHGPVAGSRQFEARRLAQRARYQTGRQCTHRRQQNGEHVGCRVLVGFVPFYSSWTGGQVDITCGLGWRVRGFWGSVTLIGEFFSSLPLLIAWSCLDAPISPRACMSTRREHNHEAINGPNDPNPQSWPTWGQWARPSHRTAWPSELELRECKP